MQKLRLWLMRFLFANENLWISRVAATLTALINVLLIWLWFVSAKPSHVYHPSFNRARSRPLIVRLIPRRKEINPPPPVMLPPPVSSTALKIQHQMMRHTWKSQTRRRTHKLKLYLSDGEVNFIEKIPTSLPVFAPQLPKSNAMDETQIMFRVHRTVFSKYWRPANLNLLDRLIMNVERHYSMPLPGDLRLKCTITPLTALLGSCRLAAPSELSRFKAPKNALQIQMLPEAPLDGDKSSD